MKSRREFLKGLLATPIVFASNLYGREGEYTPKGEKGKVVIVKSELYNRSATKNTCKKILNRGIELLTGVSDGVDGLKSIFNSDDVVGIKVNTLGGRKLSPLPIMVYTLSEMLIEAGVKADNIIIWDRSSRELKRAGFKINTGKGVKCFGTNSLINGYDSELSFARSVGSCFSKILSRFSTAIINVGVLKDHDLAGISGTLKNFYGAIHNPNKYHDNNCSPYVADLNTHPYIRKKLRLNIIDAPIGQYHGGPGYNSRYVFNFNGIIFSFDQVAMDAVCFDIIEKERKLHNKPPLKEEKRYPKWLDVAGKLGIGERDLGKIKKIEVKV